MVGCDASGAEQGAHRGRASLGAQADDVDTGRHELARVGPTVPARCDAGRVTVAAVRARVEPNPFAAAAGAGVRDEAPYEAASQVENGELNPHRLAQVEPDGGRGDA